ncbi:unnamed protein product [Pleuronectes platessa]|uniref:Uncharacterized protein n=1 Tax=Pleuronectes platessa TaxID=8262 RepID=A0A9N7TT64_PLEPL|nr:unnamed protein product [Pleuronectes platessa]
MSFPMMARDMEGRSHTGSGYKLQGHKSHLQHWIFKSAFYTSFLSLNISNLPPQHRLCEQQLVSSAWLMITSPALRHTGATMLEKLFYLGTMESLSQWYMQQASFEAFHTLP